jgi:hypothetical protein
VFDSNLNEVAFLEADPKVFAVSPDDSHLYANNDDTSVRVYQIDWNITGGGYSGQYPGQQVPGQAYSSSAYGITSGASNHYRVSGGWYFHQY